MGSRKQKTQGVGVCSLERVSGFGTRHRHLATASCFISVILGICSSGGLTEDVAGGSVNTGVWFADKGGAKAQVVFLGGRAASKGQMDTLAVWRGERRENT